jgi:ribosome-associated protein
MEIAKKICKAASDKKAGNIVIMDMRELTFSTDYFIICSAPTATQVRAIADNVEEELDKAEVHFNHKEGYHEGEWILLDYGEIVVHIFKNENREYYALEKLWGDAKITSYEE